MDLDFTLAKIKDKDEDKLVQVVNEIYKSDQLNKNMRAAVWSQNIHFMAGDQWIKYSEVDRQWKSIPVTRLNRAIDRPVTNFILLFTTVNASAFTNKPDRSVDPATDDPRDKSAAKASSIVLDYLWDELEKDDDYYEAALWGLATGTVFRKSMKIPTNESKRLPILDSTGNPTRNPKTNRKLTQSIPLKKVGVEILSPFNVSFDGLPKRFKDIGLIQEFQIKRLDWIRQVYGKDAGKGTGYTGRVDDVREDTDLTNVMSIGEGLKNVVEGSTQTGYGAQSSLQVKEANIVKECYAAPSSGFPRGRMIVVAGDVLLYRGPSPYYYLSGKVWHPYTMWNYLKMPGCIWGISLVGALIPKQRSINSIDALLAYNRKTCAVPKWFKPMGSGIPDDSFIGTPGQEVTYNELPNGDKPFVVDGKPLPGQVLEERSMHVADAERLANNAGLRQGINPEGVKTLGGLQILQEQSNNAISKPVEQWENFVKKSEQLDLLNFQDCYIIPNEEVATKLKGLSKELTEWDWDTFRGAVLGNNVSVRIVKGSTLKQSRALQQQLILELADKQLLPDIVGDPFLYKLFLEKFGLADLFTEKNLDVQKAEWVIEQMIAGQYPPMINADNPDIQLIVITRYMKKPSFMELPQPTQLLFEKRFQSYVNALRQANAVSDENLPPGKTLPAKVGGIMDPNASRAVSKNGNKAPQNKAA